jgi:hypothetical protein
MMTITMDNQYFVRVLCTSTVLASSGRVFLPRCFYILKNLFINDTEHPDVKKWGSRLFGYNP